MTSERIVMGKQKGIEYHHIFQGNVGSRTSNPNSQYPKFKKSWGKEGICEPTATIVWNTILENRMNPYEIILWNIFPFHPYKKEAGLLSNRSPKSDELKVGVYFFKRLLTLSPKNSKVISIGQYSKKTLDEYGIKNIHIHHPSYGGAPKFKEGLSNIISLTDIVLK